MQNISELKAVYTEIFISAAIQHSELTFSDGTEVILKEKI